MNVQIYYEGTLIGFRPLDAETAAWFADNVISEPWQWLGPTLWVDARYAQDIVDGLSG